MSVVNIDFGTECSGRFDDAMSMTSEQIVPLATNQREAEKTNNHGMPMGKIESLTFGPMHGNFLIDRTV